MSSAGGRFSLSRECRNNLGSIFDSPWKSKLGFCDVIFGWDSNDELYDLNVKQEDYIKLVKNSTQNLYP